MDLCTSSATPAGSASAAHPQRGFGVETSSPQTTEIFARRNARSVDLLEEARWASAKRKRAIHQQVMLDYLGLAEAIANRFRSSGVEHTDLRQVAYVGLAKAVSAFDTCYGGDIASFAVPTITGEIKRYLRDASWSVRPPRALQELAVQLSAEAQHLEEQLRRAPTRAELVCATGQSRAAVTEALACSSARWALSLDAPAASWPGDHTELKDTLASGADAAYATIDLRLALERALTQLEPRLRDVLYLRFFSDLTQQEIAQQLRVSQTQISRQLRGALLTLRGILDPSLVQ